MLKFTVFLATSPHLSNEQSTLEGVLFSPSIEGGVASAPQAPPTPVPTLVENSYFFSELVCKHYYD